MILLRQPVCLKYVGCPSFPHLQLPQTGGANMDLDVRETRLLHLSGTLAFPTPFLSVGRISFESGNLRNAAAAPNKPNEWVVVQERSLHNHAVVRAVALKDV